MMEQEEMIKKLGKELLERGIISVNAFIEYKKKKYKVTLEIKEKQMEW